MKVINTDLPDVKIIEPQVFMDERGFFMETWQQQKFEELVTGKPTQFVQDNYSKSVAGTLRGLHFQSPHSQGKLIRVLSGKIFDVAVDIRPQSEYFGKWVGVCLSESNHRQLWIPEGFAHGFYVLSETADLVYKCTDYYHPEAEFTLQWDDSELGINWPNSESPLLSEKDQTGLSFKKWKESV
ncbi:dTDP-4-dehydrorhamnose 3,5-epimerase [Parashewanella curva]|uniref:dTDP-4-dehydrorhamnose 3,5-epimerase n=1 Tax=Parashewanella curva TaxID=2338552 RepID=A0A3L8Q228_9GAMM|nr:dTDP-4-dehydrorhamnose 3,5-epimerase [Parashewanella curva]RLV61530.1 dTDP-4-dehydrorhamnose 3,5-epimerase [Parashewanella curva]